jgi:Kef-type K+ transport system membrane component KefB
VLFFVSVGMLFDPAFVLREPVLVLAALAVVLIGKPLVALAVVVALGYSTRTALVAALGLAQVGEFSFILGGLARDHGLLPAAGYNVIVACAIVSISINPFSPRAGRWSGLRGPAVAAPRRAPRAGDRVNAERRSSWKERPLAVVGDTGRSDGRSTGSSARPG